MPVPEPIVCNEDEQEDQEFRICEVDKKVQDNEMSEEEATIARDAINDEYRRELRRSLSASRARYDEISDKLFQNNASIELEGELDEFYGYMTNPTCDLIIFFWNDKSGNEIALTAVWTYDTINGVDVKEQLLSFDVNEVQPLNSETGSASSVSFTNMTIKYDELGNIMDLSTDDG